MRLSKKNFALNLLTLALFPLYSHASPSVVPDNSAFHVTSDYSDKGVGKNSTFSGKQAMSASVMESGAINGQDEDEVLSDLNITPEQGGGAGIKLKGGSLDGNGLSITSGDSGMKGIDLSSVSSATLNTVDINLSNSNSSSGIMLEDSTLTGHNITVHSDSTSSPAIQSGKGNGNKSSLSLADSNIESAFTGLRGMGGDMTLNNVNVHTTLSGGYAVDINQDSNTTIIGGQYTTDGDYASGAWLARDDTTLHASGATFETHGDASHAVNAQLGSAVVNNSTLKTSGDGSDGYYTENSAKGDGLTVSTAGEQAYGAMAAKNGQMNLTNTTITTEGSKSYGLATTLGGNVINTNSTVTTSGTAAHGIIATQAGTADLNNVSLTTSGENAYGVMSQGEGSSVHLQDSTIETVGQGGYGAISSTAGVVTLENTKINTTGDSAGGLFATANSSINGSDLNIQTAGKNAFALATSLSSLNIKDSTLNTTGSAAGLYANGVSDDGARNTVTLDNVTLASKNASGVLANAAALDLSLKNGTTLTGGDGTAMSITAAADANGDIVHSDVNATGDDHVLIMGDIISDSGDNYVELSLKNNSTLNGATQNLTVLNIDNSSQWLLTHDSDVKNLQQNGLVKFDHASGFNTLTVDGDLSGSGQFDMNTQLGDDNSPTDKMLVSGNADGSFGVTINNIDGTGAATRDGILVVKVAGDAENATFKQNNSVTAGNYEYYLNKVNKNAWYLQSSYISVPVDTDPDDNSDDNSGNNSGDNSGNNSGDNIPGNTGGKTSSDKTYRPEVAGYMSAPYLNAQYGFTSAGTYHERAGARKKGQNVWGRVYARHDSYGAGRFNFDADTAFLQLGGDVVDATLTNNWQVAAGPMVTLGHEKSSNADMARREREGLSVHTGNISTNAYGVGGYLTAKNKNGVYIDSVAQVTRYHNTFASLTTADRNGYGAVLSAEAGKPFALPHNFVLEPQAQMMGQYMNFGKIYASGANLKSQNIFIGQTRGGMRLAHEGQDTVPYLQADLVRQIGATPGVVMNGEYLAPEVRKGYWQTGAGLNSKLTHDLSLYAEVKYAHSFGKGLEGYNGNLGLKYQFK
ncbi:MAG TPA: autotransporter outer membrane beta-barrel domain-containing protein [Buttiauxella sp.]